MESRVKKSRSVIAIAVAVLAAAAAPLRAGKGPDVSFSNTSTANLSATITFSLERGEKQIAGVACRLVNATGASSTVSCGAQTATSKKSTTFRNTLSGLNAGNYTYAVMVTLTDGKRLTGETPFIIQPVGATCTVTPYNVVYDAASHTATGSCTGVGGVALPSSTLALGSTTHTNAGTYTDGWSFSDPQGNYASQTGSITDVIGQRSQAITFGAAPTDPSVGGSYLPFAVATSDLAVSFSIKSATSTHCSLGAGGAVSFVAEGTCTVEARQPGDTNWAAAPVAEQTFVIAPGVRSQTITFSAAPPYPRVGSSYSPTATATSGLPVAFTINSSTTANCSFSDGVVHLLATGPCVVDAEQPGDADWQPAPMAPQEFVVTDDAIVPNVVVNKDDDPQSPPLPPDPRANQCPPQSLGGGGCVINALDGSVFNSLDASASGYPAEPDLYTFRWELFKPPGLSGAPYSSFGMVGFNSPVLSIWPNSLPSLAGTDAGQDIFWRMKLTVTEKGGAHLSSVTWFRFDYQQSTLTLQMSSDCQRIGHIQGQECVLEAANGLPATNSPFVFGPAPVDPQIGGSYMPSVTAPYALPVTENISSSTSANCSIDSGTGLVSFLRAGTCTVEARGPGDDGWTPPRAVQTFVIGAPPGP
jgi:large repetitive protein